MSARGIRERLREKAREIEAEEMEEERRPELDLYTLVSMVAPHEALMLFGGTRTGKTTFCYVVVREAVEKYGLDAVYIDTEGNLHWKLPPKALYYRVSGLDDLNAVINEVHRKLIREEIGQNGLVVVVDSLEAPVLRSAGSSRSFYYRAQAFMTRTVLGDRLIAIANEYSKKYDKPFTILITEHARSEIGLSRLIEQAVSSARGEEGEGRRSRFIRPEEVPPEIRLLYTRPKGGSLLYLIKDIWVTEQLEAYADESGYKRTTCGVYAWGSRAYARMERVATLNIETIPERGRRRVRITYKIHATPIPLFGVEPEIAPE
ncbi:MAG: hypothetical protein DRJ40_08290 [Thermoprotei archaeon]|nr:MAG: hypothetical protein DRJ40_08290 [Thermoprotei archaeon]